MKYASDFRAIARNALKGKWGIAVIVCLIATLLGGAGSEGPSVKLNVEGSKMMLALAKELDFPGWYSKNLDALHDCLTSICEETKITFLHFPSLPFPSAGLLRVLRDSENENKKLEISLVTN